MLGDRMTSVSRGCQMTEDTTAVLNRCLQKMEGKHLLSIWKPFLEVGSIVILRSAEEPLTAGNVARWVTINISMNIQNDKILLRGLRML